MFESLSHEATQLERAALREVAAIDDHAAWSQRTRALWLDTLGIDEAHLACDLDARVTGRHDLGDVRVENLHFQAVPGARIPANLWLPRESGAQPRPCIIYLCGHTPAGKGWYQHTGRWFAQQGYPCLVLDAIQTGESQGAHHGTFYLKRWRWTSLGYSPAAVEVQIARRALDYLATRRECDVTRCGLTGISGGATMSLFTAAADARFAAAAPHCIAGSVAQMVAERSLDSHCDCATWVNRHRLGLAHLLGLVAPRALLMSFSAHDALCTPQPLRDLVAALQPLWARLGHDGAIQTSEDQIPHAYSAKIFAAILRWFNLHLRGDGSAVPESALPAFSSQYVEAPQHEPLHKLAAFVRDDDPPAQQRMAMVDQTFIRAGSRPTLPRDAGQWAQHQQRQLAALKQVTFRQADDAAQVEACRSWPIGWERDGRWSRMSEFEADPALKLTMNLMSPGESRQRPMPHLLGACDPQSWRTRLASSCGAAMPNAQIGVGSVHVRGTAQTSIGPGFEWFVRRAYPLLGRSLPERQTMDLLRGLHLARRDPAVGHLAVYGQGAMTVVAIYAALLGPADELVIQTTALAPLSHWDGGPEFPGILRVGDLQENLALFFPRPITFVGEVPFGWDFLFALYEACGKRQAIRSIATVSAWTPAG